MGTSWASIAQWLLALLCGLYCVHGLRVSSLCHIARCQRQLVTTVGFRSGGSSGFSLLDLSSPFSPSFPSGYQFGFNCLLIGAAIFHVTLAFVLFRLSLYFCHKILCSASFWGFGVLFCRRHLRSVSFSACLALVLVFRVSAYPSFLGRQWCCDLRSCSVQIKRKSMWSFVLSHHLQHRTVTCTVESPSSLASNTLISSKKHEKYLSMPLL